MAADVRSPAPHPGPTVAAASVDPAPPVRHRRAMRWALLVRGPGGANRSLGVAATACFAAGGLLLVWSAYVHFHLWGETDGYRSIATIGPLFLFQSIAGLVIGVGVVVVRRVWAALLGVGFALATLGGFVLSVTNGLFGFKESWLAPFAKEAFVIEVVTVAVLLLAAVLCLFQSAPRAPAGPSPAGDEA